jgi:ketosteroid isomerase-like protein
VSDVDGIRRTLALYSRYNDEKDSTAWSELWTEDGCVTDRSGTYRGHADIKQFVDGINAANPDRDTLHFCANAVVALNGDAAQAHTDIVFVARPTNPSGTWTLGNVNHYTDRLARRGSNWLFEDRRIDRRPTVRTPLVDLRLSPASDDHEAIRRALALYAQMLDSKDPAGCSEQFASDATLHTPGGDHVGRTAIKRSIEQQLAGEAPGRNTAHLIANSVIEVSGDTADVTSDCLVLESVGDGPWSALSANRVHDRLAREGGAWRFAWKEE